MSAPRLYEALEHAEQDVGVERALVRLVQHHHCILLKLRVTQQLAHQRAVCAHNVPVSGLHQICAMGKQDQCTSSAPPGQVALHMGCSQHKFPAP